MKKSGLSASLWLICLALLTVLLTAASAAERPLRILILSGQNNHDWASTTPRLQALLTGTHRFEVTVTDHPEDCDSASFQGYDALLSNWNQFGNAAKTWPPKMREAFLQFVRAGHGLIVVHAGSSSFLDWQDYQDLVGGTWGPETGHGPMHRFEVKPVDTAHPITRGFPAFQTTDELWHRTLTRPGIHVLATVFSSTAAGGSGKDEPVAFVTQFGKGRCFNLVLGHNVDAMNSAGFQGLLTRGSEWAASGKVTLPAPSPEAVSGYTELLDTVARYEATGSRASVLELEKAVADAATRPAARAVLARQLAARLNSNATPDARKVFCWQLSIIGSSEQVPAIMPLLKDTNFAYYARLALERIPGDESFQALRKALPASTGPERLGLITSLAERADKRAVPDLASIARGQDNAPAIAAVKALGQIGGPEALQALGRVQPATPVVAAEVRQAQLRCAAALVQAGQSKAAVPVLEKLFTANELPALRTGAFQLWTAALGSQAAPRVLAAVGGQDPVLRQAALQSLKTAPPQLLEAAAKEMSSLPSETQVTLLAILAERQLTSAQKPILGLLGSDDASVRLAAIRALGSLADADAVKPLTALLSKADAAEKSAIAAALASLPGKQVEPTLLADLKTGSPEVQMALIKALAVRGSKAAIPAFTSAVASPSPEVRREAFRALGQLADSGSCPALIAALPNATPQDAAEIQSALAEICRRGGDLSPLVAALPTAPTATRPVLLNALAAVGGSPALTAIEGELSSQDPETRLAAVRLLAEWPDPASLKALGSVMQTAPDVRSRTLALRGLARLAPLAKGADISATVDWISRVLPAANTNEQTQLLAALGEMPATSSLAAVAAQLDNPTLAPVAKAAVYEILNKLETAPRAAVLPVIEPLKKAATDPAEVARLAELDLKFGDLQKLSAGATASSRDGLKPDGQGGPPSAAIDGNPDTYWDEEDNQKLYILHVDLAHPATVARLKIMGWQQENYAPRDFEILAEDKSIMKVEGARYTNNWFQVTLPGTRCSSLELRITGYYGPSPAIRELEIYGTPN